MERWQIDNHFGLLDDWLEFGTDLPVNQALQIEYDIVGSSVVFHDSVRLASLHRVKLCKVSL